MQLRHEEVCVQRSHGAGTSGLSGHAVCKVLCHSQLCPLVEHCQVKAD